MLYNRGKKYSDIAIEPACSYEKTEIPLEEKIFRNTRSIILKQSQILYHIEVIENRVSELLEIIKKAKDEHEKGT